MRRGLSKYNGAYYYSKEICRNIIPYIQTDRNWVTVNVKGLARSHSVVFIHNNKKTQNYDWLKRFGFKDLVLVCGLPQTVERVGHLGEAIYLPLSIDVDEVKKFKKRKTRDTAYVGRKAKREGIELPEGIDYIEGLPRNELLKEMSRYKKVYAVGRTAIEAKALGCEVLPYDPRFPDPSVWKVMDSSEAIPILQRELDRIDGKGIR